MSAELATLAADPWDGASRPAPFMETGRPIAKLQGWGCGGRSWNARWRHGLLWPPSQS
jgi:hypothetical protein